MKQRDYGIDLLRILAMLMIITLHILYHGGILDNAFYLYYRKAWFLEVAAYCGVNLYALISGYVGVTHKWKWANIWQLWLQVAFYSVGFSVLFYFYTPTTFSLETVGLETILISIFPVTSQAYWYFTAYVGLFFFMPFLNTYLNQMSKKQLQFFVIAIFFTFSLMPTIFGGDPFKLSGGYGVLWLAFLYIVGAYFRRFPLQFRFHRIVGILIYAVCVFATWYCKIYVPALEVLVNYTSPTIFLASIGLMMTFANMKMPTKLGSIVTNISVLTFGVYLIHDNNLVRAYYISNRFTKLLSEDLQIFPFYVIRNAFIIFAICAVIEFVRNKVFKLLKTKELCNKIEEKIFKA